MTYKLLRKWFCKIHPWSGEKWWTRLRVDFLKDPSEGTEHDQKCIESKNEHHFEKKVFKMFNFAFLAPENSFTPKDLFSASMINIAHAIFLIAAEAKKTKYI